MIPRTTVSMTLVVAAAATAWLGMATPVRADGHLIAPAGAPQPAGLRERGVVERLYQPAGQTGTVGGCVEGFTENLADSTPAATVPDSLSAHSRTMCKMVIEIVPDRIYQAWGYALANKTLVVGDDGLIIVEALDSVEATEEALADLLAVAGTDLPIKAVIYTHSHPDHFPGVKGMISQEDADAGRVAVIAHETFMANIAEQNSVLGPVLGVRSLYSAGNTLPFGPEGRVNAGLGPLFADGEKTLIPPTMTVPTDGQLTLEIAGVEMVITHTPGDIADNITILFPELSTYHYAEVMQGENFPNLHTIRGARYRDPYRWYRSLDTIRDLAADADFLIGSHGRPVFGNAEVTETLTAYRDAIQFVHDQTVRHMNRGMVPDELVEVVTLPPHLAGHPRLGEFYGTVDHSVRQVYVGLLGFWQGDMTEMAKPGFQERAEGYVRMMGGRDAILAEAQTAIEEGNEGWAADILTWAIRADGDDTEARTLKAQALRQWGFRQTSINWRHSALTGAQELEGSLPDLSGGAESLFGAPDIVRAIPAGKTIENLSVRLRAEDTLDVSMTMGVRIEDTGETYGLEIRRGIAEFHDTMPTTITFALGMDKAVLDGVLLGQTTLAQALDDGSVSLSGDRAEMDRFFSYFEGAPDLNAIQLTGR